MNKTLEAKMKKGLLVFEKYVIKSREQTGTLIFDERA